VEAILLQIADHRGWIGEARLGELVVTAPVGLEPAGIQVEHVGRNAILPQLRGHVAHLGLGLVGDAAHPQTERPQGWHRAATGDGCVFGEHVLGVSEEHEEVQQLVAGIDGVMRVEFRADVEGDRSAGMYEHPVAATAHEERNGLVLERALSAHRVANEGDDALPSLVEPRERLAETVDPFVLCELERGGGTAARVACAAHERERNVRRVGIWLPQPLRLREQRAIRVAQLDAPWVPPDAHLAKRARVCRHAVAGLRAPRLVAWYGASQHQ